MRPPDVKTCCADLYQSELARLILGETLHPGGLALTYRLGQLMGIQPGDWLADLASGRGVSATALSRMFRCKVVGIELGKAAVTAARYASSGDPSLPDIFFLQGDAESPPLRPSSVAAIICECSMSLFPDKSRVVREAFQVLQPGGTFGISDVTLEPDSLPEELNGTVGRALCLAGALDTDGYARLLAQCGFTVREQEDASGEILALLDGLEGKIGAFLAWQKLWEGDRTGTGDILKSVSTLIAKLRTLVTEGKLGYWLLVGQKPH